MSWLWSVSGKWKGWAIRCLACWSPQTPEPLSPGGRPALAAPLFPGSAPALPLRPRGPQGPAASRGFLHFPLLALLFPSGDGTLTGSISDSDLSTALSLSSPHLLGPHSSSPVLGAPPLTFPPSHLSSQPLLSREPLAWSEGSGSISQAKPLNLSDPLLNCLCSLVKNQPISGPAKVCLQGPASQSPLLCSAPALASHRATLPFSPLLPVPCTERLLCESWVGVGRRRALLS